MILQHVKRRLATVDLKPAFRAALVSVIEQASYDHHTRFLHNLPLDIFRSFGGDDEAAVSQFAAAWAALHTVLLRLDHLQDGDLELQPLPTAPHSGASYNLVFGAYVLAQSLLDDLEEQSIPAGRLLRLRRLWNDCVLTAAGGQHHDLLHTNHPAGNIEDLDQYQWMAHAKSGALFALAFAGSAILATDDVATITACHFAGDAFGTLLQLSDDLVDRDKHRNHPGLTLDQAFQGVADHMSSWQREGEGAISAYVQYIEVAYLEQIERVLAQINNSELCNYLRQLFDSQFGSR